MDNIIAVIILAPFLLFVVYISISGIIGAIQNAILRKKEFNPEVKLRLEKELKEKDELHQKEISILKIENSKEIANIRFSCNQEISKAKSDAERRVSEYAANAQFRESQLDHQIFTLKAENQALNKKIKKLESENENLKTRQQNPTPSTDLYSEYKETIDEIKRNTELIENVNYWAGLSDVLKKAIARQIPVAYLDKKLLSNYIKQMKTTRLSRAIHEEMRIDLPFNLSATVHTFNDGENTYNVSLHSCECVDFQKNQMPCKHMIALAIKVRALSPFTIELSRAINDLDKAVTSAAQDREKAKEDRKKAGQYLATCKDIEKIVNEKKLYYPWLADLITRYEIAKAPITVKDTRDKRKLTKEITACKKEIEKLRSILLVYEKTVPFLAESKDLSPEEFIKKAQSKQ